MTRRQKHVLWKVAIATHKGQWYRAESHGERVTLASLYHGGALTRRAWRGKDGEPDAANEYMLSEAMHQAAREPMPLPRRRAPETAEERDAREEREECEFAYRKDEGLL